MPARTFRPGRGLPPPSAGTPPACPGRSGPARAGDERGVALVEFALVLPVLMMLLVGIVSAGTTYDQQITLTQAVREGARYGAIVSPDQTFESGTWATNVRDIVRSRSSGELSSTKGTVCVSLVSGATATTYAGSHTSAYYSTNSDGSPCDSTDTYTTTTNDDGMRIQVSVSLPGKLDAGVFAIPLNLHSSAVAQSEFAS
jgi:Flp pilus assembly protein TadG